MVNLGLILAAWLAAAAGAMAWDSPPWPSWQWQTDGRALALDAWASLTDRCDIVGASYPAQPGTHGFFWMKQRAYLASDKAVVADMLGHASLAWYQRTGSWWIVDGACSPDADGRITNLTLYGCASNAATPWNYLAWTPWMMLNGWGNRTNDVTVGRPHGYSVPSFGSVAGVPNAQRDWLPIARTNAYTTDYGWAGWTNTMGQLHATATRTTLIPAGSATLEMGFGTNGSGIGPTAQLLVGTNGSAGEIPLNIPVPSDTFAAYYALMQSIEAAFWSAPVVGSSPYSVEPGTTTAEWYRFRNTNGVDETYAYYYGASSACGWTNVGPLATAYAHESGQFARAVYDGDWLTTPHSFRGVPETWTQLWDHASSHAGGVWDFLPAASGWTYLDSGMATQQGYSQGYERIEGSDLFAQWNVAGGLSRP